MRPTTLYKYIAPERTDVLESFRLRYSQAAALNDPFECLPSVDSDMDAELDATSTRIAALTAHEGRLRAELDRTLANRPFRREALLKARLAEFRATLYGGTDIDSRKAAVRRAQDVASRVGGCLCLSATASSILMWSHYAANHTGFVVSFDADHKYFRTDTDPVVYSDTRPAVTSISKEGYRALFFTKSKDWAYEKEYRKYHRFDVPTPGSLGNETGFRPFPASSIVDEERSAALRARIELVPFPKESISTIIVGWNSQLSLRQRIGSLMVSANLKHVRIFQARPSDHRYEMEICPI